MKDDKENDIEMNDGDSTESPADGNNMHANPESEKKPHNRKVIAAICGLALVALIGGGAYYGIGHPTGAGSKTESVQANDSKETSSMRRISRASRRRTLPSTRMTGRLSSHRTLRSLPDAPSSRAAATSEVPPTLRLPTASSSPRERPFARMKRSPASCCMR